MSNDVIFADRDHWLAMLARGWRLHFVVDVMPGGHGDYSVMLWRSA